MACGIAKECIRSKRTVEGSLREGRLSVVSKKRVVPYSGVTNSGDVAKKSAIAGSRVLDALCIAKEGQHSIGCVAAAGGVAQKRRRANGRVSDALTRALVSDIEKERAGADSCVEAAVDIAKERKPTRCCVSDAGGEILKGIGAFCRVESWIASIRRRHNRLHAWQKPEGKNAKSDEK